MYLIDKSREIVGDVIGTVKRWYNEAPKSSKYLVVMLCLKLLVLAAAFAFYFANLGGAGAVTVALVVSLCLSVVMYGGYFRYERKVN